MKKSSKKNKYKILAIIFLIGGITLLAISLIHIYNWVKDSNKTKENIAQINNKVTITEDESKISVDFSEIESLNSDTIGWIKVSGTEVNYPFTQTTNNEFYLNHSFDKSYNSAGWIFLDFRNNIDKPDKNNILYAHGRLDNTMFGSLKNIFDKKWYENPDNYIIKTSTKTQNHQWKIFSIYHLPATEDYLKINFNSDSEFTSFANMLKDRSFYDFEEEISASDSILTLSTCYKNNSKERLVVHAKLIE